MGRIRPGHAIKRSEGVTFLSSRKRAGTPSGCLGIRLGRVVLKPRSTSPRRAEKAAFEGGLDVSNGGRLIQKLVSCQGGQGAPETRLKKRLPLSGWSLGALCVRQRGVFNAPYTRRSARERLQNFRKLVRLLWAP